jgi:WD40 repeat protein
MIRSVLASLLLATLALPAAAQEWQSAELRDRQAGPAEGVAFTRDGKFLASSDSSGTVMVRMFPGAKVYATLRGVSFSKVAWSYDGRTLVAGGLDNLVYVFSQPFMDAPRTLPYPGDVLAVAVTPDGVILAAGRGDHLVRRWRMPVMAELPPFVGPTDDVYALRVSPDGGMIVAGGKDRLIRIWDAAGYQRRTIRGRDDSVYDLAFSPDGTELASAYEDGTIGLWNTQTWRLDRLLPGPSRPIQGLAMSADGRWLAGAGRDRHVWIWALGDTAASRPWSGHRRKVNAVAFSPSGYWLASAASDTTVRLWKVP